MVQTISSKFILIFYDQKSNQITLPKAPSVAQSIVSSDKNCLMS